MAETLAPPEPAVEAKTDEQLKKGMKIQVVDVTEGRTANSIDRADEFINEQTTERGFRGLLKRIWHGNIARDYIRLREIAKNNAKIDQNNDVWALEKGTKEEHDRAMAPVVKRFTNEAGLLHSGEANEELASINNGEALTNQLSALVNDFASGRIDVDTLQAEKTRLIEVISSNLRVASDSKKGLVLIDNVIEVAMEARAAFEHGVGIDRIDAALSAKIGEAHVGVRTEAKRDAADRVLEKLQKNKVGCLVNDTTLAAGVGLAMSAGKFVFRKAGMAAAATVGLGVGAGVFGGLRERLRIKQERQLHGRQMAEGDETAGPAAGRRREQLEATRYETAAASDLITGLQELDLLLDGSVDAQLLARAVADLGHVSTRIKMSDDTNADFITYDGKTEVEQQRFDLDLLTFQLRVKLQTIVDGVDDSVRRAAGLVSGSVGETIDAMSSWTADIMKAEVSDKDRVFQKLRRNRTWKMGAISFASGIGIGLAVQEMHALVSSEMQSVFEHAKSGNDRRTVMAGLLRHDNLPTHHIAEGNLAPQAINEHASVVLPSGYHIDSANGVHNLIGPNGKTVIDHVGFDEQGHFDAHTQAVLDSHGIQHHDVMDTWQTTHTEVTQVQRSPEDFINAHPEQFAAVHRDLWYDNNTPAPKFDLNELKLQWGGDSGTGINANGDYVFNVHHMMAGGSFHADQAAHFQELIDSGQLKMGISMSRGTQHWVQLVSIDHDGNGVIDHNSFVGQSVFDATGGHAHFNGGFAEVMQVSGTNPNGETSVRTLATLVGDNQPKPGVDTITRLVPELHERVTSTLAVPIEAPLPTEIAPVFPFYWRRGLEKLSYPSERSPYYYTDARRRAPYGYVDRPIPYIESAKRAARELAERREVLPFAPELLTDPDFELDATEIADRYFAGQTKQQQKKIAGLVKQLDRQPKATNPKVVIAIAAAAHQEGGSVYNTLQQYVKQKGVTSDDYEIVVYANYPEGAKKDKTTSEIERFQKEHPEVVVRFIERQLPDSETKQPWVLNGVRKDLTDVILQDLRTRGVDLNKVIIAEQDVDTHSVHEEYVKTVIEKTSAQPEVDSFLGNIDFASPEEYAAYPEMLISTRFMQMLDIHNRVRYKVVGLSGANHAFRPAIYMATGGYDPTSIYAEDKHLQRSVKLARKGATTHTPTSYLGRKSTIVTSGRRAIEHMLNDSGAPVNQWEGGVGASDSLRVAQRDLTPPDLKSKKNQKKLIKTVENMINETMDIYLSEEERTPSSLAPYELSTSSGGSAMTHRAVNRMFLALGIRCRWLPNGQIEIVDGSRMIAGLQRQQLTI